MTGSGWKDALLGGWDVTNITMLETGPWLTPSISAANDQANTNVANRGAILRPDVVSNNYYAGQSRAQYFNLAAFSATPAGAGRFGNAGVGILQGPGTAAVSLGVAKSFAVRPSTGLPVLSLTTTFSTMRRVPLRKTGCGGCAGGCGCCGCCARPRGPPSIMTTTMTNAMAAIRFTSEPQSKAALQFAHLIRAIRQPELRAAH